MIQVRLAASSKITTSFVTLVEGFQQFDNDLNKLQVCERSTVLVIATDGESILSE